MSYLWTKNPFWVPTTHDLGYIGILAREGRTDSIFTYLAQMNCYGYVYLRLANVHIIFSQMFNVHEIVYARKSFPGYL